MPYTDFHYTPTGTGVISGKEVLEQTEDAINDLGGQISGDVQTAIDTANNALNTANTASADAQNAVNTANTAYTAATNAQNTANAAQTTATNAQTAAQNAQNDVNALGNRVTTAEGNITQNTNAITGLTTRMGTAEGNITTLQNDVVTAQGTATSAQNTATMARQQAYVLRYSSTAITDNSTIAYSTLDNTDNIKVSDKIIASDGKIFSVVSIDSANETVTVGSALIDLAQDSDVVHKSGDETVGGNKTFTNDLLIYNSDTTAYASYLNLKNQKIARGSSVIGSQGIQYQDKNNKTLTMLESRIVSNGNTVFNIICYNIDGNNQVVSDGVSVIKTSSDTNFAPTTNNAVTCGRTLAKWSDVLTYKVNGVEPSSLSLPRGNVSDVIDISSYLTILDGSNVNTYVAPANGWISILMNNCSSVQGYITGLWGHQIFRPSAGSVRFLMPVLKNQTANILVLGGTIGNARFIPCQGNV